MHLLKLLKQPKYLITFLGISVLLFDLAFYMMISLPGERDLMCVEGAYLTPLNIVFSIFMSMALANVMIGIYDMNKHKKRSGVVGLLAFVGTLIGSFTVFCTYCTLPVLSLFGLSFGLSFFTFYNEIFKIISLILIVVAYVLLNKKIKDGCKIKMK